MSKPALLDSISPGYKALASALTAAGLDPLAIIAKPSALKEHIDAAVAKAREGVDVPAAIEAATAELQGQLTAEKQAKAAIEARANLFTGAVEKFGAQPKAADEKAGLTAADVEKALADRASVLASSQLAKMGLDKPLPVSPAEDPTKTKDANALTRSEFFALSPVDRLAFSKRGGRLID